MPRFALALLVVALIGGTAAAFAVTETLKLRRAPVFAPTFDRVFSPVCGCESARARLRVSFREADRVTASVIDDSGALVRTLASGAAVAQGELELTWDGRTDQGAVSPDGRYRLKLDLDRAGRTIVIPAPLRIDTEPPRITALEAKPLVLSPDGDGVNDRLRIVYRASEKSAPLLFVNGQQAVQGDPRRRGRVHVDWGGRVHGEVAVEGRYEPSLQVRDLAGNLSAPVRLDGVNVRFLSLDEDRYTVERGGSLEFGVSTDATPFDWQLLRSAPGAEPRSVLSGTSAESNEVAVRLPRRIREGRYTLRVRARGHEDEASVQVRRAAR